MLSIGRYDLGLSEADFWDLTPAQFDALCERAETEDKASDYRAGVIASILANTYREKGSKAITPKDLFPNLSEDDTASNQPTGEQMLKYMRTVSAAWGKPGRRKR